MTLITAAEEGNQSALPDIQGVMESDRFRTFLGHAAIFGSLGHEGSDFTSFHHGLINENIEAAMTQ